MTAKELLRILQQEKHDVKGLRVVVVNEVTGIEYSLAQPVMNEGTKELRFRLQPKESK